MTTTLTPAANAGDHQVHFYRDLPDLTTAVVDHLAPALEADGMGVIIATQEHLDQFRQGLAREAIDVGAAETSGRLLCWDAEATLRTFLEGEHPDAGLFENFLAAKVRLATSTGRPVYAFGEMVSLLWDANQIPAALELEQLWNELIDETKLSLLCGYSTQQILQGDHPADMHGVLDAHSCLVGGSVLAPAHVTWTLPASADSAGRARHLVRRQLRSWQLTHLNDDASLVVTELVTNAVRHAQTSSTLSLAREGDRVIVAVSDRDIREPVRRQPGIREPGGWGLRIIDTHAVDWGCTTTPSGKLIWAELGTPA